MNKITVSELNSTFKDYIKYNTSFIDALLSIMYDKDLLQPEDIAELNRRQVSSLARLDQLEASANEAVRKNPNIGEGDIRSLLKKIVSDEEFDEN